VSALTIDQLLRENRYLLDRNAQLQADVTALTAESERLRQMVERMHGRVALRAPNALSGGQP
jgi:cell division septum initiation protein DivIVA